MKRIVAITGIIVMLLVVQVALGETIIIANSSIGTSSLSKTQLTDIFTKKMSTWSDGSSITPVALNRTSETMQDFLNNTIKFGTRNYISFWQEAVFTGSGTPPRTFDSEEEAVKFILKTPGAIGVINSSTSHSGTKVITVK